MIDLRLYNGWRFRLPYLQQQSCVQFEAPEGFLIPRPAPAYTTPGFAVSPFWNLLVSINTDY